MLKKLLKYDFKAQLKFWWIASVATLLAALMTSGCIYALSNPEEVPVMVLVASGFMIMLFVCVLAIYSFLTEIIVFVRFYKNLFSDEGYLTFTLPVKTASILNSKLISATVLHVMTAVVLVGDIIIALSIGMGADFYKGLDTAINDLQSSIGNYLWLYIAELLILTLVFSVVTVLFTYICISVAAVITKKARVITAIGIYYLASSILSLGYQFFVSFGLESLSVWMYTLSPGTENAVVALILLVLTLFFTMIGGLMYVLQRYILDRKLNLA